MKKLTLFLIVLSLAGFLTAQDKGSITGKVLDAKAGVGLPGVNVLIKGTYYGANTDVNGGFAIKNVSPGSYTVEVSLIGYKTTQLTGVKVTAGKATPLEIKLDETVLTLDQDIVVIGDKPLVNVEETQSRRTISKDDIDVAVVENISDIVVQQAGVVQSDNAIHIRGGRSYENAFLLDGVSVQDPLSGTGFGLQLSAGSIEEVEVITGGFNAEFGQATSGIVNVKTREGAVNNYNTSFGYKTDKLAGMSSPFVFNTDIYEASLGGPEPITRFILPLIGVKIPGEFSVYFNFYVNRTDGLVQGYYKPKRSTLHSSLITSHILNKAKSDITFFPGEGIFDALMADGFARAENNFFYLEKYTYKYSPTLKFVLSHNQSVGVNQNSQSLQSNLEYVEPSPGFQYEFQYNLENANVYTHLNDYKTFTVTHTLSSKLFYELKLNYFTTFLRADANGKKWNEYTEPKDIVTFPIEYYNGTRDTIGVIPGDGFWDVGNPYTWHDHHVKEFSIKGDLTNFFDEKNKFKSGFNLQFQEMQVVDIYKPWVGELGLNNDIYKVYPALGSMYAQDNINFGGMILNFGLRLDFWFPGKFVDDAIDNPAVITIPNEVRQRYKDDSFGWFGNRHWKGRLSPRLGISHPITDNQTLFFSYGHFSKWPKPQFVYAKLNPFSAQSSFQKFGNPNLKPETTVAYELGVKTQFTTDDVLTVTAYYKDIFDYVNTRSALISSARFATQRFITYVNQDYARSRGLEFEYKKRIGKWFTGSASFTYAIVTGKSSSADEGVLVLNGVLDESIREEYVGWDRPFTGNLSMNFYVPKGEPLFDFGYGILDDYNVYFRFFYQSGKRYTESFFTGSYATDGRPEYETVRNTRYNKIAQNWFWLDMNFEKYFKFSGLNFSFTVEVNNLLDTRNPAIINPVTGKAYEYGDPTPNSWNDPLYPDLQAPINPYPTNPVRYLTRRNVRAGISFKF